MKVGDLSELGLFRSAGISHKQRNVQCYKSSSVLLSARYPNYITGESLTSIMRLMRSEVVYRPLCRWSDECGVRMIRFVDGCILRPRSDGITTMLFCEGGTAAIVFGESR